MGGDAAERPVLRPLRLAALGYTLFVIYGCLVPFHFTPLPWAVAWARFEAIPHLALGPAYRSDWVANVLLFCLSAYLWTGSTWPGRAGAGAAVRSALVWMGSIAFVTSLEFAQVYFPPRSVALQDVFAGSVGAAIGIALWWLSARRVLHLLARWSAVRGREGLAGWLLWPYTTFLTLYDLMPLDLSSSPHVLYDKWQRHMIWLVPFASLHGSFLEKLYSLGVEALLWFPIAALWVLSGRGSGAVAWCVTVSLSIGVETLQLLVQSRVSDVTDVACAAAGGALGIVAGAWLRARSPQTAAAPDVSTSMEGMRTALLALVGFFAWSAFLVAAFCYPFDFRLDPRTFGGRVNQLFGIPFRAYWLGSEFHAFFELLRKVVFFAPLGALLATVWARVRGPLARRACAIGSVGIVALVAGCIEAIQVLLPERVPDSTDILAGTVGGALGYAGVLVVRRKLAPGIRAKPAGPMERAERSALPERALDAAPRHPGGRPPQVWMVAGVGYALLALACLLAASLPTVPYNVRELFLKGPHSAMAVVFPLVMFDAFMPPGWIASWLATGSWRRASCYPFVILAHVAVTWIGVRAVVPLESIGDIVGAPVLHWPWEWELIARFAALFGAISVLISGGTLLAGALCGVPIWGRAVRRWILMALPLLAIAHYIVVVQADTDNLVELMAGGGSAFSTFWISAWLISLAAGGSALAMLVSRETRRGTALLLAASSVPFGWMSLSLGTAPAIAKYGAVFSAVQFLLSPDRDHYVVGSSLAARYVVAHAGILAAIALTQAPLWARSRGALPLKRLPAEVPQSGN